MMPTNKDDRSVRQLFSELAQETSDLIRQEISLGKAEMSEKVSQAGSGASYLAIGGLVAYAGLLALLAAAIVGLNQIMSLWLAALLVGVAVMILGIIFIQKGRSDLKAQNLVPNRTAESLRRDTQLVKEHSHGRTRAH